MSEKSITIVDWAGERRVTPERAARLVTAGLIYRPVGLDPGVADIYHVVGDKTLADVDGVK